MRSNLDVTVQPDRLWRFLLAWISANGVAPTVFVALVLAGLFISDTLGNQEFGASLGSPALPYSFSSWASAIGCSCGGGVILQRHGEL
jgi:hypothetical protein